MIKVGIVDDHAIVRAGLKQFFAEQVDLRVVGDQSAGSTTTLPRASACVPPRGP